jgi:SAM-dependent methyltransferase
MACRIRADVSEDRRVSDRSVDRFTDRVEAYVRYRPGYPDEVVGTLAAHAGLRPASVVADVGAGTGISTALFLRHGCRVYAVEPNDAMRALACAQLGGEPRFHSIRGTAEETTLPERSVDVVVAGQAFHWFDQVRARREFGRILTPQGWVALMWNDRRADADGFARAYESLLRAYGVDYEQVHHRNVTAERLRIFFGGEFDTWSFPNEQRFDFDGVRGRLLSSSYAPAAGQPNHRAMLDELRRIFDRHQELGCVRFVYETRLHIGRLHRAAGMPETA